MSKCKFFTFIFVGLGLFSWSALSAVSGAVPTTRSAKANADPIYMQLRSAKLSGRVVAVQNCVIKRDVATFTFKSGEFHFLAPADDRYFGAVFVGDGEFQLTPHLATEQKFLAHLAGATTISEHFEKMMIWFTDRTSEEIKGSGTEKTGPPDNRAQDILDSNRKYLRKGQIGSSLFSKYNMGERLLVDLTCPAVSGMFYAFFEGKHYGELLFAIDPLGVPFVTPEEVIFASLAENSSGIWTAEHLREHYAQDPTQEDHNLVDMQHYQIEATTQKERLDAKVQARFTCKVDGIRVIPFDLFPKLRMMKVTGPDDSELGFIQEDKDEDADFAVVFPTGLKKGQEYTLTFVYGGDKAILDAGGGNYTLIARSNWYPANGTFTDRATFEITLKTPKGLTMVATGQPIGESQEGDLSVTRWKSDIPLQVAGFNYGDFKKSSVKDEKTNYTIEAYANNYIPDDLNQILKMAEKYGSSEVALGSLNNTVKLMDKARAEAQVASEIYTDMFGPIPYGRLAMTQQPFWNFGQAWPMVIYIPLTAFLDSTQRQQLGMGQAVNFFKFVAAHETAHEWWGHLVGWKSYRDQWISEGGAECSASIFAQSIYKNKKFMEVWADHRKQVTEKNTNGKSSLDVGGVTLGYRANTGKTGNVAFGLIYSKGAYIFHMLRMMMWDPKTGDARFSEMMKDFVKTYYNQNASTSDFQRVVEKHITKEMDLDGNGKMDWFFRQWVDGTYIPDYKLDYRLESAEGGKCKLVCKITQGNVDESFAMRVPIYLDFDGNITRLGAVNLYGNSSSPEIPVVLPKKPKRVLLCAFDDVLCTTNAR